MVMDIEIKNAGLFTELLLLDTTRAVKRIPVDRRHRTKGTSQQDLARLANLRNHTRPEFITREDPTIDYSLSHEINSIATYCLQHYIKGTHQPDIYMLDFPVDKIYPFG